MDAVFVHMSCSQYNLRAAALLLSVLPISHPCTVVPAVAFASFPSFVASSLLQYPLLSMISSVCLSCHAFPTAGVSKFSPYGSVCCACAQRPGLPRQSFSRTLRSQNKNYNTFSMGPKLRYPTLPDPSPATISPFLYAILCLLILPRVPCLIHPPARR